MAKKLTTTVYITEKQQAQLKELNERTHIPVAEFIRQGIDLILKKHENILSEQMVLPLEDNQNNLSSRL